MPSFRTARVAELIETRPGLQRVQLDDGSRAYSLTQLTGTVAVGDRVVVNTTAVELGLGTGGWHVVHWNLSRDAWSAPGDGHIMKLRYTSLQVDTGAAEEHTSPTVTTLDGLPVVACALHSQVAAVAAAFNATAPGKRLVYVMTDGGALPLALSDLVHALSERGLLAATVTAGHAFGGDYEAVNVHSALLVAREFAAADAIVAGIGPGVVGTNSKYGHTGLDVVTTLDAAAALRGVPILAVRYSDADERERHQGPSHHTMTAIELASRQPVLPSPDELDVPDMSALFQELGLHVTSMGRGPADDGAFFQWAGAAGVAAAKLATDGIVGNAVIPTDDSREDLPRDDPGPGIPGPNEAAHVEIAPQRPTATQRAARWAMEWLVIIAIALAVVVLLRAFLVQTFYIPSASMDPTLRIDDRILVNKVSYKLHDVNRGDIVVFSRPECDKSDPRVKDLVKRVVALEGERFEARDGDVFINGRRLAEPYLPDGVTTIDHEPFEVPDGHIWVMGDNRANSKDSRYLCNSSPTPIPVDDVVGRAFVRVWPFGEFKFF